MVKYFIIRRPFIMASETFSVNNVLEGLLW